MEFADVKSGFPKNASLCRVQKFDDIFYKGLVLYYGSLYCITTYAYCQYYNSFKANLQKMCFLIDWSSCWVRQPKADGTQGYISKPN